MKLLSFGEIIWDVHGDVRTLGGAPLNLAAHAALQGCEAHMASSVGDDELGLAAVKEVGELGIKTEYITVADKQTGACLITLNESGIPRYNILEDTAYDSIALPKVTGKGFDVIAYGTLALRGENNRRVLSELLASEKFGEVYTDLNIRAPFYSRESIELCLKNATIVKISDEELPTVTEVLFGRTADTDGAVELIKNSYPDIRLIVLTMGAEGARCYDCKAEKVYFCPAAPATVVSSVGAGDSFGATFLTQYLKSGDIMRSMELAARVSAFVVSNKGAIPEGTAELIAELI